MKSTPRVLCAALFIFFTALRAQSVELERISYDRITGSIRKHIGEVLDRHHDIRDAPALTAVHVIVREGLVVEVVGTIVDTDAECLTGIGKFI